MISRLFLPPAAGGDVAGVDIVVDVVVVVVLLLWQPPLL